MPDILKAWLLHDEVEARATYKAWAAHVLTPKNPSWFLTVSFAPKAGIATFNQRLASDFRRVAGLVVNIIDEGVYGNKYHKLPPDQKFPFVVYAETHSRFGSETHMHLHVIMAPNLEDRGKFECRLSRPWCTHAELGAWLQTEPSHPDLRELMTCLREIDGDDAAFRQQWHNTGCDPVLLRQLESRNLRSVLERRLSEAFGRRTSVCFRPIHDGSDVVAEYAAKDVFNNLEHVFLRSDQMSR